MKIQIYYLDKILFLSDKCEDNIYRDVKYVFQIHDFTQDAEKDAIVQQWLSGKDNVYMFFDNTDLLLSFLTIYMQQIFSVMYAAGGLIYHPEKGFLFIFKKGYWDLPKGKIDKGEKAEDAAIRECEEETGVSNLKLQKNGGLTYHIFRQKNKMVLKITQWYLMETKYDHPLIPQAGEGIENAEWIQVRDIQEKVLNHTYFSVKEIIERYILRR